MAGIQVKRIARGRAWPDRWRKAHDERKARGTRLHGGAGWASCAAMLAIRELRKSYAAPEGGRVSVVDVRAFDVAAGAQVALRGASGTGKTTLLHLIAGIVAADGGTITLDGEMMTGRGESARDRLRAAKLGYVFQTFNLMQGFTAEENVRFGMAFGLGRVDRGRARRLLARVGLGARAGYYPRQLSSGQQQRVAVARALAGRPRLVLADEPTGNLDAVRAGEALGLIREVCREAGAALLLVSHDEGVLRGFETVVDWRELNRARPVDVAAGEGRAA